MRLARVTLMLMLAASAAGASDKLTFHHDRQRSGWNAQERVLTPAAVASGRFGPVWQSPRLDGFGDVPPRIYAAPLYMASLAISEGPYRGTRPVVFAATSTGYAYAIAAAAGSGAAAGAILWRRQLTARPCDEGATGNLATPVIDLAAKRLYVTSCDNAAKWQLHALDLGSGRTVAGWPIALNAAAINRPGINRNGANRYTDDRTNIQRGALNLSADGRRLYVAIGPDSTGWLVAVDTARAEVASAFSTTATDAEDQGGMWAAAGPSIDAEGRIHIATGSKFLARARKGVAGIFPDSAHNWGQSLLQFRDDADAGLTLAATYSPFNYCLAGANDIDLGASGTIAIDLPAGSTATPRLLALGGKQGNLYLLNRDALPGGVVQRPPCSMDPDTAGSLLAPEPQPHFGLRGPLLLFGPYSDYVSMLDQAKSRSTPAWFRDAAGAVHLFATGSAKTGDDFATSTPPGLVRVRIVTTPGEPAYPRIDAAERTQTFHNPGSPVVSSAGGAGGIVWVLDTNAPRTAPLYGASTPKPILYAFDALTLKLLWKNAPGVLFTSGKYSEPSVVDGMVLVGTDRIQAFGLRAGRPAAVAPARVAPPARPRAVTATAPARAAPRPAPAAGRSLYQARCAACHSARQPGTPSQGDLVRMPPARIVAALATGVMRPMATGMSRAEMTAVAAYLTGGR